MQKNTKKRITRRVVNSKRHTTHYVISGRRISVGYAVRMARQGRLAGVRVVGNHIQAAPGCRPLNLLPTTIKY